MHFQSCHKLNRCWIRSITFYSLSCWFYLTSNMWIKNFLFCRIMIPDLRFGWLILCWYFCVLIADDPAEYNDTPGEFFVVSFDWLSGHKNLLPMDIFRLLQPPFGEKSDFEAILVISHPFYGSILHWQTCFLWDFYCVYYNHSPSQELNFSFV